MAKARLLFAPFDMDISSAVHSSVMKGKERKYLKDLKEGDEVDQSVSVKQKRPPRPYAGGRFFELRVSDRSAEMNLKFWGSGDKGSLDQVYASFCAGDVVKVRGNVGRYWDALEISVSPDKGGRLEKLAMSEVVREDFVARSEREPEQLMAALNLHIRGLKDEGLRALLTVFFSDEEFVERFRNSPGSMWMHCNWIGGLAEHTLKVVEICEFLTKEYPKLDHDLLIAGALLHDVGKVSEYVVTTNIDVTPDGMLRGHIAIGAEMISRACDKVPAMSENLRLKVVHMVLSSHGELEFGSPKKPQFPEAYALNFADDLDAKLEQFIKIKEEARTEDPWIFDKRFGQVYLR
ncbi:MAG: HD domain-containing protein [Methanomassiliicoccales archaeon]|nr:HD domain-containing protein [Methanomassiliicoccales archaeon]